MRDLRLYYYHNANLHKSSNRFIKGIGKMKHLFVSEMDVYEYVLEIKEQDKLTQFVLIEYVNHNSIDYTSNIIKIF